MLNELKLKLDEYEASKEYLAYAMEVVESGVGFKSYANVVEEIKLLTLLNKKIGDYLTDIYNQQEEFDLTLQSVLSVELKVDKKQEEDEDELPF